MKKLKCKRCGHRWIRRKDELPETCPKCRSPDFKIIEGRGIWLEKIKGVK